MARLKTLFTSPTGARRYVPPEAVGVPSWASEMMGGYADLNIPMNCRTWELSNLLVGDRVEVWAGDPVPGAGRRLYRGYIADRDRQIDTIESLLLRVYGPMQWFTRIYCATNYPQGGDFMAIVSDVLTRHLLPNYPAIYPKPLYAALSGIKITQYDARGKSLQQVLTELCDLTANDAGGPWHWVVEVDDTGGHGYPAGCDALDVRKIGSRRSTHVISIPGRAIGATSGPAEAAEIVNRLWLTGGQQDYPNLLPNGDFRNNVAGQDRIEANLLANPGFELGGSANAVTSIGWTLGGGASIKQKGQTSPTTELDPHGGNFQAETDNPGEYIEQYRSVEIPEGHKVRVEGWHLNHVPSDHATGTITFYWEIAGPGFTLATDDSGHSSLTTNYVSEWARFSTTFTAPANVIGFKFRIDHDATISSDIYWDDIAVWDDSISYQEGWLLVRNPDFSNVSASNGPLPIPGTGTADVTAVDWTASGAVYGPYAVSVSISALTDSDGDDVLICPLAPIPVTPGQIWEQGYSVKAPLSAGASKAYATVRWLKSDYTLISETHGTVDTIDGATYAEGMWHKFFTRRVAPSDAAFALPVFRMRYTGTWEWSGFMWVSDRAPWPGTRFISAGNLYLEFAAEDADLLITDTEVLNSAATYGPRWSPETAPSVTDYTQALAFAVAYFLARAKLRRMPIVPLLGAERDIFPGDLMRAEGESGPTIFGAVTLPVARLSGRPDQDGMITEDAECGYRQPTTATLMMQAARSEINRKL